MSNIFWRLWCRLQKVGSASASSNSALAALRAWRKLRKYRRRRSAAHKRESEREISPRVYVHIHARMEAGREREIDTYMYAASVYASERASVCVFPICIPSPSEIIKKRHICERASERAREDAAPLHSLTCGRDICMEYCIKIEQPKTSLFPTPPEPPQAKAASLLPIQNFIFNSAFPFSFFPFPTKTTPPSRYCSAAAAHAPKAAVSLQLFPRACSLGRGPFRFSPSEHTLGAKNLRVTRCRYSSGRPMQFLLHGLFPGQRSPADTPICDTPILSCSQSQRGSCPRRHPGMQWAHKN